VTDGFLASKRKLGVGISGDSYKGKIYGERVGDKGNREAKRRNGESERRERKRERPTLNYSKISESAANLLSLGKCDGVISVKITL